MWLQMLCLLLLILFMENNLKTFDKYFTKGKALSFEFKPNCQQFLVDPNKSFQASLVAFFCSFQEKFFSPALAFQRLVLTIFLSVIIDDSALLQYIYLNVI